MTTTRPPLPKSQPARWELRFPAKPGQLAEVRHRTQEWLKDSPLDEYQAYDVLLAVGEACANAVEHGHRGDGGTIRLMFSRAATGLRITVADHGSWKRPEPSSGQVRGRGMAIIRALIPEVEVTITSRGTTVEMGIPLPR